MKKVIVFILCLLGCGCTKTDARYEVESYLNKFKNHDEAVISSLNDIFASCFTKLYAFSNSS